MTDLEIRVDADEVTEALDKLDRKATGEALKGAIRKSGQFLKPKMKAAAPKGPTGKLRKEVRYKVKRSRREAGYFAVIRSFAPHHHLVVQGTQPRHTKAGAYRGRMPANPYVDRVADQYEQQAIAIAEEELARRLELD